MFNKFALFIPNTFHTFVLMKIDGNKLRTLRESQNLSRLNLALECDISPSIIDKIERGERSGLCVIYKLADFFKVKIEDLI